MCYPENGPHQVPAAARALLPQAASAAPLAGAPEHSPVPRIWPAHLLSPSQALAAAGYLFFPFQANIWLSSRGAELAWSGAFALGAGLAAWLCTETCSGAGAAGEGPACFPPKRSSNRGLPAAGMGSRCLGASTSICRQRGAALALW